jgi:Flp pilus assembly protein TadG
MICSTSARSKSSASCSIGKSGLRNPRSHRRRGTAMLELALIGPWIFFLFIGALDWGFLAYGLISLQTATRTAAVYTATDSTTAADSSGACSLVLAEMRKVSNIGAGVTTCAATPIVVSASAVAGPDAAAASRVSVTYTMIDLIPIPGLLPHRVTITRQVTMRLRS